MKRMLILWGLLWGLASCTTLQEVSLDIVQPAPVTLPVYARSIAVVSTAAPLQKIEGRYFDGYGSSEKMEFNADADVARLFAREATKTLHDTHYFSRVELCDAATDADIKSIKDTMAVSAVLLLDSFSLNPVLADDSESGYLTALLQLKGELLFKLYTDDDLPPETIVVSDSLQWESFGTHPENRYSWLPGIDQCLEEFSRYAAYRTVHRFVPGNRQVDRFYFKTPSSLMKDADRYWQNGQYDEASYLWEYMYETSKKEREKAMAAANLALYYELCDNFIRAKEWASLSISLFGAASEEGKMMASYRQALEQRIADDEVLRFQLL